jgi:hypothetical protein
VCSSLRCAICCPNDTHIARFATHSQSCAARDLGNLRLSLDLVFSDAISRISFAFQSPRADRRFGALAGFCLSARMAFKKLRKITRFTRQPEQTSRRAATAQGDLEMEQVKLANASGHELSIGHSPSSARKKAVRKKAEPQSRSASRRASRNQGNWVAAIAGAMTWLRVSSSGGIGDAVSVSVNAMGRPGRGRRRSRNSSNTTSDEWPGSKGLGPFSFMGWSRSETLRNW